MRPLIPVIRTFATASNPQHSFVLRISAYRAAERVSPRWRLLYAHRQCCTTLPSGRSVADRLDAPVVLAPARVAALGCREALGDRAGLAWLSLPSDYPHPISFSLASRQPRPNSRSVSSAVSANLAP